MINKKSRKAKRDVRHVRTRKRLSGTTDVPRLSVFKSSRHIYAQIIDDTVEQTIAAVSSLTPEVRQSERQDEKGKIETAKKVGGEIGRFALSKGIKKVRFDRGGYPYHGRIKALAEGAREAGLEF